MTDFRTPDWLADAVFYQIFPDRFANGDPSTDPAGVEAWGSEPTPHNFFGGDLAGMTAHLDHVTDVGANALYLTPIFAANTNHRYDATDYFAIDPVLGTLGDFRRFVSEAHARGIRIVLDAVLNHCGDGHPYFRDVVEREEESELVNWFLVEGFPITADPVPNYRTCSGCYYLPKWNAYNPAVRKHHLDVARAWIGEGIDGWRLDVPYYINHSFWREFRAEVKGADESLYIVAEEWREPEQWLQGDIADGTMNYTLRDLILGFTADKTVSASQFARDITVLRDRIPEPSRAAMLNLLGSHDTERVLTRHAGRVAATLLAHTLLVAAEGAPMIYYGDEIGMVGENDPGCRGCMIWEAGEWNEEVHGGIKQLLALRKAVAALRRGSQHVVAVGEDVLLMLRDATGLGQGAALIAVNRGRSAKRLPLAALTGEMFVDRRHGAVGFDPSSWAVAHGGGLASQPVPAVGSIESTVVIPQGSALVLVQNQ